MIDLLPSAEQQQIIDSVSDFFEGSMPVARLRDGGGAGHRITPAQWLDIARLGWFGLGVAEEQGGVGFSVAEEVLVAEQIGRYLGSPALAGTMVAAHLAAHKGESALLARIVAGDCRVGIAKAIAVSESNAGEYHLIDAEDAELLLVWREQGAGLVRRADFGNLAAVTPFDDSTGLERGRPNDAAPLIWVAAAERNFSEVATLLTAAQLAGAAAAARDLAVEYAKIREQFGQPIGAFQAIKHRCADMAVAAEAAHAQICFAALMLTHAAPDTAFQVAVAAVLCAKAALENARSGIQIHGGIGFTADCNAHWYLKRAHLLEQLAGAGSVHRHALLNVEPVL
jgi:alkylation response protein AidB-like acyl-CoA dehydrogenase